MRWKESIILTQNENVQGKFTRLTMYDSNKIIAGEPNLFIYLFPIDIEKTFDELSPAQNDGYFAYNIFKCILLKK